MKSREGRYAEPSSFTRLIRSKPFIWIDLALMFVGIVLVMFPGWNQSLTVSYPFVVLAFLLYVGFIARKRSN